MATISSAGIGSGLDVDSIVTKLMAIEKQPLTALQTTASTIDSKISAFGTVKSQLSSLSDAISALAKADTWKAKAVSSSDSSAVAASVSDAGAALATSFSVGVTQLARAQSVASAAVAAGSSVGSGTLSIQLGTWDTQTTPASPSFTAGSAAAVSVTVTAGDSMATIASKINAAGAGVTATVLKDLSGERLLLRSSSTGEAAGFRVQATDSDGNNTDSTGLSALAFDNPAAAGGMAANPVQYGLNAKATINGIAVTSATNTLTDTVPGLTLALTTVTTTPVEVAVSNDTTSQRNAISGFVKAYNATNEMLNAATKYDATSKTAALLQGDSTTVGLQNALRSLINSASGGGALQHLSDLGISIAKDGAGNLAIDDGKLSTALKNPAAVQQFFAAAADASGSNTAATGFATRFAAFTQSALGSTGTLSIRTSTLTAQKTSNGKDQDRMNDRLTTTEARLRKQYSTLDSNMSSLTALNTYITQQIAQWNKSTK